MNAAPVVQAPVRGGRGPRWSTAIPLLVVLLAVVGMQADPDRAGTPALGSPEHGLLGHYYASGSFELDELSLPVLTGPPAAVRVDPQIAFGRSGGFDHSQGQLEWYAHPRTGAVFWRGYIRFPAAGTYHLTTASRNASAVYLNEARVALNVSSGHLPAEAFGYGDPGIDESWDPDRHTYLVPIEVDGPSVYPIEVRYQATNRGTVGFGIDLYWVRPGAPTGPDGRPLAEIVPRDALYVAAPADLVRSDASAAHTTIASDFLYYPAGADSFATLEVRVADARGRPLPGRRVHVSTLTDRGTRDVVEQAAGPTDENGVATVRVRPGRANFNTHTSRFFATVLGEWVDADQVAEMEFSWGAGVSFLPYAFAPYYDGRSFLVTPQPLRVGRPTTITVPLTNRQSEPYEVSITVTSKETNIGAAEWEWNPLGRSESVVLAPGETRELSIEWTPEEALFYLCFRVTVWGRPVQSAASAEERSGLRTIGSVTRGPIRTAGVSFPVSSGARLALAGFQAESEESRPMESRQQNVGEVAADSVAPLPSEWEECTAAYRRAVAAERDPRHEHYVFFRDYAWRPGTECGFVYIAYRDGRGSIRGAPAVDAPIVGSPANGGRAFYSDVVRVGDRVTWYRVHPPGGEPGWIPAEDSRGHRPPRVYSPRPDRIRDSGIRGSGMQGSATAGGRG